MCTSHIGWGAIAVFVTSRDRQAKLGVAQNFVDQSWRAGQTKLQTKLFNSIAEVELKSLE